MERRVAQHRQHVQQEAGRVGLDTEFMTERRYEYANMKKKCEKVKYEIEIPDAMVPGQGLRVQVQEVQQLVIQVLADLLLLSIDVPLNSIPCLASCGEGETAAGSPDSCRVFPLGVQLVPPSAGAAPGFPCAPSAG